MGGSAFSFTLTSSKEEYFHNEYFILSTHGSHTTSASVMNSENKEYHSSNDTEKDRYFFFHWAEPSKFFLERLFAINIYSTYSTAVLSHQNYLWHIYSLLCGNHHGFIGSAHQIAMYISLFTFKRVWNGDFIVRDTNDNIIY